MNGGNMPQTGVNEGIMMRPYNLPVPQNKSTKANVWPHEGSTPHTLEFEPISTAEAEKRMLAGKKIDPRVDSTLKFGRARKALAKEILSRRSTFDTIREKFSIGRFK